MTWSVEKGSRAEIGGDSAMGDVNKTTTTHHNDNSQMLSLVLAKVTSIEARVATFEGIEGRVKLLEEKQNKKDFESMMNKRLLVVLGIFFFLVVSSLPRLQLFTPSPTSASVYTFDELEEKYANGIPSVASLTPPLRAINEWCMTPALDVSQMQAWQEGNGESVEAHCTNDKDEFEQWLKEAGIDGVDVISFVSSEGINQSPEMTQNPILGNAFKCAGLNYACAVLYFFANTTNLSQNFYLPSMPSGWDNQVSSADSWTWHTMRMYEHINFSGASIDCTCYSMGAMDRHTSSIAWYN